MTVRKIFATGRMIEGTGAGYAPVGEFKGSEAVNINSDKPLTMLLRGGILCNDSDLHEKEGKWIIKGDPTEGSLVVTAAKAGLHIRELRLENPRIEELPFSSERKRMTTIHQMEDGKRLAFMKGAPEIVMERCTHIMENGGGGSLTETEIAKILKVNEEKEKGASRGL